MKTRASYWLPSSPGEGLDGGAECSRWRVKKARSTEVECFAEKQPRGASCLMLCLLTVSRVPISSANANHASSHCQQRCVRIVRVVFSARCSIDCTWRRKCMPHAASTIRSGVARNCCKPHWQRLSSLRARFAASATREFRRVLHPLRTQRNDAKKKIARRADADAFGRARHAFALTSRASRTTSTACTCADPTGWTLDSGSPGISARRSVRVVFDQRSVVIG